MKRKSLAYKKLIRQISPAIYEVTTFGGSVFTISPGDVLVEKTTGREFVLAGMMDEFAFLRAEDGKPQMRNLLSDSAFFLAFDRKL